MTKKKQYDSKVDCWTTKSELEFIKQLGTLAVVNQPRKVLLRGYLNAAEKRTKWGGINKYEVIDFVKQELERY